MFQGIIYHLKSLLNKPFKVGITSYYYPNEKVKADNGVSIHTYYLSRELAKVGCEVHVFCRGEKESIKTEYLGSGKLVIHRIGIKSTLPVQDKVLQIRIRYFMFDNRVTSELIRENSHEKFDIVHTHGWLTAGAFIAKQLNSLKWIHTFHAVEKNRLKFMTNEEKSYSNVARWVESTIRYADALIAVSKKIKLEVLQNYPVKNENIFVIPNGVDKLLFHPDDNLQKDKRILYVGRFSLEKGIDLVYKIAKKILDENKEVKFEMVAAQSVVPSLQKLNIDFENLLKEYPERFIWHKTTVNRQELAELYQKALIYIQPSRYEACPICPIEAMSCGKAVICSNRGGMPELIGNAGIIVPLNTSSFIKNISRLLDDYRLRERYVRRAIERAKMLTWENIAERTLKLYKETAEKKDEQEKIKESMENLN